MNLCTTIRIVEEKDWGIDHLRKNVQVVLTGKERSDYLGELYKSNNRRKSKKHLKTDGSDSEYQIAIVPTWKP